MSSERRSLKSDADRTFPSGGDKTPSLRMEDWLDEGQDDAFRDAAARHPANDAGTLPGLRARRTDDLVIAASDGLEESISYHLYLGTTLAAHGTSLVIRFATRTVRVSGERLGPYRDALVGRRLERLQITPRSGLIHAQHDRRPVITHIAVYTPKGGEVTLDAELEAEPAPAPGP